MGFLVGCSFRSPQLFVIRHNGEKERLQSSGTPPALQHPRMQSTFLQRVIICMVLAFFAACLIQWGKVFVEGADDALNSGYKKDASALVGHP